MFLWITSLDTSQNWTKRKEKKRKLAKGCKWAPVENVHIVLPWVIALTLACWTLEQMGWFQPLFVCLRFWVMFSWLDVGPLFLFVPFPFQMGASAFIILARFHQFYSYIRCVSNWRWYKDQSEKWKNFLSFYVFFGGWRVE
jgi:hypothetical protein